VTIAQWAPVGDQPSLVVVCRNCVCLKRNTQATIAWRPNWRHNLPIGVAKSGRASWAEPSDDEGEDLMIGASDWAELSHGCFMSVSDGCSWGRFIGVFIRVFGTGSGGAGLEGANRAVGQDKIRSGPGEWRARLAGWPLAFRSAGPKFTGAVAAQWHLHCTCTALAIQCTAMGEPQAVQCIITRRGRDWQPQMKMEMGIRTGRCSHALVSCLACAPQHTFGSNLGTFHAGRCSMWSL